MSLSNVTVPGNVSVSTIPQCAITCTISVIPVTDCKTYGISNFTCLCTSNDFQTQFLNCQKTACTSAEFQAAQAFGASSCAAVGHPITLLNITNSPNTASASNGITSAPTATGSAPSASSTSTRSAGERKAVSLLMKGVGMGFLVLVGVGLIF